MSHTSRFVRGHLGILLLLPGIGAFAQAACTSAPASGGPIAETMAGTQSPATAQAGRSSGGTAAGGGKSGTTLASGGADAPKASAGGSASAPPRSTSSGGAGSSPTQPSAGASGANAEAGTKSASAGSDGGSAGMAGSLATPSTAFRCPSGPFPAPLPMNAAAQRVEASPGLPPSDAFNDNGNTRTNVEGPVWIDGKLYVSEFAFMPTPSARILALEPSTGSVTVALANAGSNGLAVDGTGALIATDHVQGAVVRMRFPLGAPEVLVSSFEGKRFNSPNDLAVRSDGTIYFSDPDYQGPSTRPQSKTRVYRLPAGATAAISIDDTRSQPNGVTLSADEKTLYVAGTDGIFAYPVLADGTVMPGSGKRIDAFGGGADGLGMDCAGNLYATSGQRVVVLSPEGKEIGTIAVSQAESVTNVAFGGVDHKTLYVTSMGTGDKRGVFSVVLNVPGFPY